MEFFPTWNGPQQFFWKIRWTVHTKQFWYCKASVCLSAQIAIQTGFFFPMCVSASPLFCAGKYDLLLECVANLIYLTWFFYRNVLRGETWFYVGRGKNPHKGLSDQCIACLRRGKKFNLIDSVSPRILKKNQKTKVGRGGEAIKLKITRKKRRGEGDSEKIITLYVAHQLKNCREEQRNSKCNIKRENW